ncbi:unknown [[Mannheimia] succiniciproducens MBEL55E]|uniref:Uncharacterized protein n=1 Tax=Mannheimia succiniciproducens (strain KCTC 0769BP / MBEL55E) TaxID=221988 RepID=Q65Q45_MANSM|nr:unknown [[Mannheimia] succiniciproducens MBEL55E]
MHENFDQQLIFSELIYGNKQYLRIICTFAFKTATTTFRQSHGSL